MVVHYYKAVQEIQLGRSCHEMLAEVSFCNVFLTKMKWAPCTDIQ